MKDGRAGYFEGLLGHVVGDLVLVDHAQLGQHFAQPLALSREERSVVEVLLGDNPLPHQELPQTLRKKGGARADNDAVLEHQITRGFGGLAREDSRTAILAELPEHL